MPNLIITGNTLTMSSREIAELTGKEHFHVKRDIERMLRELGKDASSFGCIYLDGMNREQTEFRLDRELTETLVTGYSIPLRHAVIKRLHEMEAVSSQPRELSRMDLIQLAMDSEQARLAAEAERDHAIATKALIGSKREATAMATASAAKRKVRALQDQLGVNQRHATVIAVERATGQSLARNTYVELRRWCKAHGQNPVEVVDARYGTVKAWPAGAWLAVHGINLSVLFSSAEDAA